MRRLIHPAFIVAIVWLCVPGCDRDAAQAPPPPATAPAAAAAQASADVPVEQADSAERISADLLQGARDLNAWLGSVQSDADAAASAEKLDEIAARHEAIIPRVRRAGGPASP